MKTIIKYKHNNNTNYGIDNTYKYKFCESLIRK